jgi:hypothetical protein
MQCPICSETVGDVDLDCAACHEPLAPWRTLTSSSDRLRERGLLQASQRDFVASGLSFLQAALTNPFDTKSLIDAGRAMLHMNRLDDGLRLLNQARARDPKGDAPAVIAAVEAIVAENERRKKTAAQAAAEADTAAYESPPDEADSRPAPPDVDAVRENGPARRELLALPVLARRAGWGRKVQKVDPLWRRVLTMEAEWEGDWSASAAWFEAAVGDRGAEPLSALAYGRGLGAWQQNRLDEARRWFERAADPHAAVLNPAAYYLAASLDGEADTREAVRRLTGNGYAAPELESILKVLEDRVGERLPADWQPRCDELRTILQSI